MKASISNIAWPTERDPEVGDLLTRLGVDGIEVAPTKLWESPTEVRPAEVDLVRRAWSERGIEIVAMQSLLYGHPELTLFESADRRHETTRYLSRIIEIGGALGAKALVFGSPKNRQRRGLDNASAWEIAVDFFGELGRKAAACGTHLVLEANPTDYAADFITSAGDAVEMVNDVAETGFQLHLDAACMDFAGDDPAEVIQRRRPIHVHVTEPWLGPVGGESTVDHQAFADALRAANYADRVSVEMRPQEPFDLAHIERAITFVQSRYLSPEPLP